MLFDRLLVQIVYAREFFGNTLTSLAIKSLLPETGSASRFFKTKYLKVSIGQIIIGLEGERKSKNRFIDNPVLVRYNDETFK